MLSRAAETTLRDYAQKEKNASTHVPHDVIVPRSLFSPLVVVVGGAAAEAPHVILEVLRHSPRRTRLPPRRVLQDVPWESGNEGAIVIKRGSPIPYFDTHLWCQGGEKQTGGA